MAFALGSFVDGLFSGAKSTFELMETKNKLDTQYQQIKDAADLKRQADAALDREIAGRGSINVGDTAVNVDYGPGSGSSTAPPTEIKEAVTPTSTGRNAGAPGLWGDIRPLISKRESGDRANIGYGEADLTNAPAKPGYFGFPDWKGNEGPQGISHAAGLYQIQPEKWKEYAGPLGVTDFTPESQHKVAEAIYLAEGIRPWASNRALIGDLAGARLLGGAATSAARVGAGQPSALNPPGQAPVQSPGSVAPDLEGQRGVAKPVVSPERNMAASVVRAVTSGAPAASAQPAPAPVTAPPVSIPPPAPAPSMRAPAAPADPAASSMGSTPAPAASPAGAGTVTVSPPPTRVLAGLRSGGDGGGMRPQSFMGPPPQSSPGSQGPQRTMAQGQQIIRLPDGTMVDRSGNVVRQAPSALYPR